MLGAFSLSSCCCSRLVGVRHSELVGPPGYEVAFEQIWRLVLPVSLLGRELRQDNLGEFGRIERPTYLLFDPGLHPIQPFYGFQVVA